MSLPQFLNKLTKFHEKFGMQFMSLEVTNPCILFIYII
jgi:hypothetical protein